ncbi:MAG: 4Fe-4S binding protein [Coriobacteriia bacterium]|nr:4Fe-4S binding protein [Coriobacteriia bacterium]
MASTITHLFRPNFNGGYPDTPKVLPERSRMSLALAFGENGLPLCKACGLCERSCPDAAIRIVTNKREDGPGRVLDSFEIDLGLCMYCGLCVEVCPAAGIMHTGHFEVSTPDRADTRLTLWPATVATRPAPANPSSEAVRA